jgi:hypothetical protein
MTSEKWNRYPVERQILMIGSEFARAKNLLRDAWDEEVRQCYERAFELLDLCAMDPKWRPRLKELLRFREMLGELYLDVAKDDPRFMMMYSTLMNWTPATAAVEL